MRLADAVTARAWPTVLGYGLFVALLAAGYYYNVTFVQLGLIDLGTRLVGLSRGAVAGWLAVLALLTVAVAVTTGVTMDRRGWSADLRVKLRLLLGVVAVQVVLTAVAPGVRSVVGFGTWIVVAAVALGVGVPVAFSLAVDLVAVPDRGYVAAFVTALVYVAANAVPLPWTVDAFSRALLVVMVPGLVALALLVSDRLGPLRAAVDDLAERHRTFGTGRFCRPAPLGRWSPAFWSAVALMFGVFFVDSLGFLRIIEEPALVLASWQSPSPTTRLFISGAHVVGAVVAGVLYVNFDRNGLFLWVLALFSLTSVLYTSDLRLAALFPGLTGDATSVLNPLFYAVSVSFYTTLNFALWPDLATTANVGTRVAVGVGVAGWLATFLSSAVALYLAQADVGLLTHLNLVNALALLLFAGLAVGLYGRRVVRLRREVSRS